LPYEIVAEFPQERSERGPLTCNTILTTLFRGPDLRWGSRLRNMVQVFKGVCVSARLLAGTRLELKLNEERRLQFKCWPLR